MEDAKQVNKEVKHPHDPGADTRRSDARPMAARVDENLQSTGC